MQVPKIVIKHSRIEINNYDIGDAPQLEYFFSVWDPMYPAPPANKIFISDLITSIHHLNKL